jgi:hypothetical protein
VWSSRVQVLEFGLSNFGLSSFGFRGFGLSSCEFGFRASGPGFTGTPVFHLPGDVAQCGAAAPQVAAAPHPPPVPQFGV